jgi:hypothetical protein
MKALFALTLAAVALPGTPALAQGANREYREDLRDARRDYRENLRDADDRRDVRRARQEYRRDVREAQRDWRQYRRYDHNRYEPGQRTYYADRYYRDGRYYQPRALGRNDRVYRGNNGQYYCRRNDGTTGLIIGGLGGGVLGNIIAPGGSRLLGTILGGAAGAAIGNSVDRGRVRCR